MTIFGYGAFKEVIKVKWGHKSGVLIQYGLVSLQEEEETQESSFSNPPPMYTVHTKKDYSEKMVIPMSGREALPETNPVGTLITDF